MDIGKQDSECVRWWSWK